MSAILFIFLSIQHRSSYLRIHRDKLLIHFDKRVDTSCDIVHNELDVFFESFNDHFLTKLMNVILALFKLLLVPGVEVQGMKPHQKDKLYGLPRNPGNKHVPHLG